MVTRRGLTMFRVVAWSIRIVVTMIVVALLVSIVNLYITGEPSFLPRERAIVVAKMYYADPLIPKDDITLERRPGILANASLQNVSQLETELVEHYQYPETWRERAIKFKIGEVEWFFRPHTFNTLQRQSVVRAGPSSAHRISIDQPVLVESKTTTTKNLLELQMIERLS